MAQYPTPDYRFGKESSATLPITKRIRNAVYEARKNNRPIKYLLLSDLELIEYNAWVEESNFDAYLTREQTSSRFLGLEIIDRKQVVELP